MLGEGLKEILWTVCQFKSLGGRLNYYSKYMDVFVNIPKTILKVLSSEIDPAEIRLIR
jgi:hypothetical protein